MADALRRRSRTRASELDEARTSRDIPTDNPEDYRAAADDFVD